MGMSLVKKMAFAATAAVALSASASATCTNGLYCNSASSGYSETVSSYGSAYRTGYTSYTPAPQVVPFSTPANASVENVTNLAIPGLGPNERLCEADCPVNVWNPEGGKVLGCYEVCKPVQPVNYVRVVRPVIYVRYPVRTPVIPVPVPVPTPVAVPILVEPVMNCYAPVFYPRHYGC